MFNVGYCNYIESIDELVQDVVNEMVVRDNHVINLGKCENSYELTVSYIEDKQGSQIRYIQPYIRNVDVAKPKESANILIPDYFIIMINDYFINSFFSDKRPPT